MSIIFTVVMLTLLPSGGVIKNTSEIQVKSMFVCNQNAIDAFKLNDALPKNKRVVAAICEEKGKL